MCRTTKQALSVLLVVLMLLAVLPFGAFAADGTAEPDSAPTVDKSTVYVNWEIAAEDPVSSCYFVRAVVSEVNGHDYLYLATRGGKLFVYDVDEDKVIDSAMMTTDTPRNILVDENGIVWVTGGNDLLRYDPFTGTDEVIKVSGVADKGFATLCGIASDGNGKLYFGTMNHGYIVCYDTAKQQFSTVSEWLGLDGHIEDAKFSGYGGIVYKDGFLYLGIDGDMNSDGKMLHAVIKYDIANQKIVDSIDITRGFGSESRKYLDYTTLVGDILFCSFSGIQAEPIYIDISGSRMKFTNLTGMTGHGGAVTEELNGKRYFTGYTGDSSTKGFMEYDVATKTAKPLLKTNTIFRCKGNNFVTVEGDDRLPGKSVVIPYNDEINGVINLYFWNPQTNELVDHIANIGLTGGVGSNINSMTADPTGDYIYVGAYSNTGVAKYSVKEGKVVDSFKTYSHQTDALMFYGDYLYSGNYSAGTICQIDPNTYEVTPLFTLRYSAFEQCRMFNMTAGENKVFCATVPYSGFGGALVWYDLDKKLTYVATGPNPEDVYYADTSGLTAETNVLNVKYQWHNAVTGEIADFDDDNDGKDDVYLPDGTRRCRGVVTDQVLNNIIYQDGYIYGTSSMYGASGTFPADTAQPVLFVYDVKAMKLVATCDLADHLEGFTEQIALLDQFAADPDEKGKFWGGVDDTLYSCTFDTETMTFCVKEELSIQKDQNYSTPGYWRHRDILFNGEYLYVGFGRHVGTYMVRKNNPSEYYLVNEFSPNSSALGSDGNIYWLTNETNKNPNNLNVFPVGEKAAPLVENAPIDTAQKLIAPLDRSISFKDKDAILAARAAYDKLTDEQKAQVTNLDILLAAEEAYAALPMKTAIIVAVAVIAVAGIAVAVVIVLKKKKNSSPDTK